MQNFVVRGQLLDPSLLQVVLPVEFVRLLGELSDLLPVCLRVLALDTLTHLHQFLVRDVLIAINLVLVEDDL